MDPGFSLGDTRVPTYVYECNACGEFEHEQSVNDAVLERCPQCGGGVRRVIAGGVGTIVKGRSTPAGHCGNRAPCCGRETRCDKTPCST